MPNPGMICHRPVPSATLIFEGRLNRFFMYWAPGATHGPHQVPKEWSDKYKGKFDDGWDKYRERAFRRAKQMGWIPPDAQLTLRPATLASWDSIPDDEKPFQRRLMEVFAGFSEHVGHTDRPHG